jgi:DNA oxidative demethylase
MEHLQVLQRRGEAAELGDRVVADDLAVWFDAEIAQVDTVKHGTSPSGGKSVAAAGEPLAGLVYAPDFLSAHGEGELVTNLEALEFHQVVMHDTPARRTTAHFGWEYGYDSRDIHPAEPIPEFLVDLRQRAADLIDVDPEALAEVLITRYPAGATIGWHRDAPMFGPKVVGVSLLSSCIMRFRRRIARGGAAPIADRNAERRSGAKPRLNRDGFIRHEQPLEARSAYVLGGPARSAWQHSIPPVASLRYSITFRTLRHA